ncbi:MAG: HGGxSTG domain-containing protein [Rhodomicrobium sp.]
MALRKLSKAARQELFRERRIDNLPKDQRPKCGARTRSGEPCKAQALTSGRCRLHGGLSTGARSKAGKQRQKAAASAYMRGKWEEWNAQPAGGPFSGETREALRKGQKRRRALEALLRDRPGKRVRLDEDAERQPDWKLTVKQLAKWGISVERYGPKNKLYIRIPSRKEQGFAKLPDVRSHIMDSLDDRQGHDAASQLISGIAARACV